MQLCMISVRSEIFVIDLRRRISQLQRPKSWKEDKKSKKLESQAAKKINSREFTPIPTHQQCIWKTATWLQQDMRRFFAWQCFKMPFHLCALHNPNPLEFLFTKQQTPQLSVQHLFVCPYDNFQKLLFLLENINTEKSDCTMFALAECNKVTSHLKPRDWNKMPCPCFSIVCMFCACRLYKRQSVHSLK